MPGSVDPKTPTEHSPRQSPRIELPEEEGSPRHDGQASPGMRNSKGWDGKLRVQRTAVLANPEVLSDPESDDENVVPGEELPADEGKFADALTPACGAAKKSCEETFKRLTRHSPPTDLLDGEDLDTDELIVSHARVASIPALRLERFTKVVRLCLRQNSIQDIDGLSALAPTLEDLDFYDNLISHIRGLEDLTNLTSLDLSFNKIKHIKRVNHLTKLKELFLVANKVGTIENLDGLVNLTSLELGSNRIRVLQNLDSLKNLEELWVAKNKITELTGLGGLPNLRLLSIQSNRIRDLSPLKDVPSLEELYISHNALTSLEGIEQNEKLRVLDISNNAVASVKGLKPLKNLEEFWASYNQISDFNEVEKELKDKEHLTTVYFEGNPLQLRGPAVYRNKVRLALPQLSQIDATFVRT
ncbi:Protein phosphatase 1 regulatory subunit SDS22 [Colletotrichum gloeosporioides]|uniref:Protein phosphatase 1 regulatory subunit SDS22 n=1 Tax=Colletotrichum gloeosporioides TaxID=474922 RepID=A0A8H4CMQ4_COLGL|nr:Protein phosphatase 1 regulatory subunit SDS22 [Colletotrichum gloeosporioides]KAF3806724.1 Protein phosphatase 1 regulatory subunit SDS22 [Colletotrichum gloeosporioides]